MKLTTKGQYLQLNTPETGKVVAFAPTVQEQAKVLVKAANKGHYYPLMAMKHLFSISHRINGQNQRVYTQY